VNTVVLTTIQDPTPAVRTWATLDDWRRLAIGDRKTPEAWSCPGWEYLGPRDQVALNDTFANALPWNHYCRKNLGYLAAIRAGATAILDTDDDNSPKVPLTFPATGERHLDVLHHPDFVNVYRLFCPHHDDMIWPRGLPLDKINTSTTSILAGLSSQMVKVAVWQGLVDGDPDVDAVFRLTRPRAPFVFAARNPIVLDHGTLCPFNSQNTLFDQVAFPLLYLPSSVSPRYADILRSYVAQPILWCAGYRTGFVQPTAVQVRNTHDLMADLKEEMPMYLTVSTAAAVITAAVEPTHSMTENLLSAYTALARHGIVSSAELYSVQVWISVVAHAQHGRATALASSAA
jgi:hypothetical protein